MSQGAACAAVLTLIGFAANAQPLIDFPTENRELLSGRPDGFFMYVDRDFDGKKSKPWQGGQYGYVRGPRRIDGTIVYASMHEGIDICPLRRDAAGNPLDPVNAVADGTVVHANTVPRASNYGRYVVVEHQIEGSPYYSLYAHLASVAVKEGDPVRQGGTIGIMGWSGSGLDRERAHVHLEFALMNSPNFQPWHERTYPGDPNPHGNFNGRNLTGINPAELLLAVRTNPGTFRLSEYLRSMEPGFKIVVPNSPHLALLRMYPWLVDAGAISNPPAWTLSFTRHGVPVRAEPCMQAVDEPVVAWVRKTGVPYMRATRGLIAGTEDRPVLSDSGKRLVELLTMPPAASASN